MMTNLEEKTVLVAMSGGVDSSVAAALLQSEGYKVTGATMKIWDEGREEVFENPRICCSLSAVEDALAVCEKLRVSYHLLEYQEYFKTEIVENFCSEYQKGRTPNPCVLCNTRVKFDHLLEEAGRLGCAGIATGHYARIERGGESGLYRLRKGKDPDKDQSYFLYGVTQAVLSRLLFPVGQYTKGEIRDLAAQYHLPVAQKEESQEICFIPDNDHVSFLKRRFSEGWREGEIRDRQGTVLGRHPGYMHYTVGQRRGLGVAHAVPLYVTEIRPAENLVIAGPKEELMKKEATVLGMNWIAGSAPPEGVSLSARIRYRHREAPAHIELLDPSGDSCRVFFEEPQEAITVGQSMVFYEGEYVVGGGIIDDTAA